MYRWLRPLLFRLEPERAHELALSGLSWLSEHPGLLRLVQLAYRSPGLATEAMGLRFPSPIGLAAGMDKNAAAVPALAALGFGFVEIGSVTAQPQPGNPKPRLFRLPQERALINRMGFNNLGADAVAARLARWRQSGLIRVPVGINIGKSKAAPLAQAPQDYRYTLTQLYPYGDYFVINVSSPNTPGLRELQDKAQLGRLLSELATAIDEQPTRKPLLVKIAPELSERALDDVAELCLKHRLSGIIATNTTTDRSGLRHPYPEAGGLSGAPLKARALAVLSYLSQLRGQLTLIAAGGIETADDVRCRLEAGASLVQLYTALVYEGPGLPARLARQLAQRRSVSSVSVLP